MLLRGTVFGAVRNIVGACRRQGRVVLAITLRRLMFRTTVIAIAGSVGKTTTKECLAAILSAHGRTLKTPNNWNGMFGASRTLLGLMPWHRYAVIELGIEGPNQMWRLARLVRPDIAVVLSVARTHTRSFATLEDTAAEKATLLDYLPRDGIAILNGDDPRVRNMAEGCQAKCVLFGQTEDCDVVAEDVRAAWPERLNFTLRSAGGSRHIQTQLVGSHWTGAALASLAVAEVCGVPPATAASALASVPPFAARMQPVMLPSGAVVIRDEENGSPDTVDVMLRVLRESQARRRILVFSDFSDVKTSTRQRLRDVGKVAAELTDMVLFVGEHGHHGVRGAVSAGMAPEKCRHIAELDSAAEFLKGELRDGDIVFLKGRTTDHLSRLLFAQFGEIGCWKRFCHLTPVCDVCPELKPKFDLARALVMPIEAVPTPSSVSRGAARTEL